MTDRELLEMAAKAAGIGPLDFDYAEHEGHGMYFGPRLPMPQGVVMAAMHTYWNPFDDDGDALRLLKLKRLRIDVEKNGNWLVSNTSPSSSSFFFIEDADLNRAIVRAAAEIGQQSGSTPPNTLQDK